MIENKLQILLADDDDDDREFFNIALGNVKCNVELITANNGEQVINFFKNKKNVPDLVFLDINMPKADGIECLKYIKTLYPSGNPTVIMLSTASSEKIIDQSLKNGASIYIEKPNKFNDLIRFLDYCINDLKSASPNDDFVLNKRLNVS